MKAILYRYPHPTLPDIWIYCGQSRAKIGRRHKRHSVAVEGFGRRFKKFFPNVELPQPIVEEVDVVDHLELNGLEIEWMFRYHTWFCDKWPHGMNLSIPGSHDYKSIAAMGQRVRASLPFETQSEIMKRVAAGATAKDRSDWGKAVPRSIRVAAARKANETKDAEGRSQAARKRIKNLGPERLKEIMDTARYAQKLFTPEQWSERARKRDAAMTSEQRSERAKKGQASRTFEERSESAHKRQDKLGPERRSEIARKRCASMTAEQWAKKNHTRHHTKYWNGRGGTYPPKPSPRCDFCIDEGLIIAF